MTPGMGWVLAFFIALILLCIRDAGKSKKKKTTIDGFLHDTAKPEPRRRAELASFLGNEGCQIVSQDIGMLQVKEKKPFSFITFVVLLLLFALPGILYLIWYCVQAPKVHTFVLDV